MTGLNPTDRGAAREVEAVLVDVGGTLWGDRARPPREALEGETERRLRAVGVDGDRLAVLTAELAARLHGADDLDYLDIWSVIEQACAAAGVLGVPADRIRHAFCLPAATLTEVFPGARQMLQTIRDLRLRCVIASNAVWRTEADYRDDLEAFGLGGLVDGIVCSVDTRWRKPDPRLFQAALERAAAPAHACLMIGNSEAKDIVPAAALGMRTVRVAIEERRPAVSRADFICDSLEQAAAVVRGS